MGSPPRVRGKVDADCSEELRFVDHPRVCGEKNVYYDLGQPKPGSPPRVRGKGAVRGWLRATEGITPACAGKSLNRFSNHILVWDHPRVCGEKKKVCQTGYERMGSPPRVRGKAQRMRRKWWRQRITPACAGKRLKRSHSIGHFSCILYLFHSVLHRASVSGGSRAGPCAPPCLPAQNAVPV